MLPVILIFSAANSQRSAVECSCHGRTNCNVYMSRNRHAVSGDNGHVGKRRTSIGRKRSWRRLILISVSSNTTLQKFSSRLFLMLTIHIFSALKRIKSSAIYIYSYSANMSTALSMNKTQSEDRVNCAKAWMTACAKHLSEKFCCALYPAMYSK